MNTNLDIWMIDELQKMLPRERAYIEKITDLDTYINDIERRADKTTATQALKEIENCKTHPIGKLIQIQKRLTEIKTNYGLMLLDQKR